MQRYEIILNLPKFFL